MDVVRIVYRRRSECDCRLFADSSSRLQQDSGSQAAGSFLLSLVEVQDAHPQGGFSACHFTRKRGICQRTVELGSDRSANGGTPMKKFLKWAFLSLGFLIVIAFVGFLYLIPPFKLVPPEGFIKPEEGAYPALDHISDPESGESVSRNLTPDPATGLARRTDAQVLRTLRTGVFAEDGRVFSPVVMPWPAFSHLTEEDRYAIVTFLRQLKPVSHKIPDHLSHTDGTVYEVFGQDYSSPEGSK